MPLFHSLPTQKINALIEHLLAVLDRIKSDWVMEAFHHSAKEPWPRLRELIPQAEELKALAMLGSGKNKATQLLTALENGFKKIDKESFFKDQIGLEGDELKRAVEDAEGCEGQIKDILDILVPKPPRNPFMPPSRPAPSISQLVPVSSVVSLVAKIAHLTARWRLFLRSTRGNIKKSTAVDLEPADKKRIDQDQNELFQAKRLGKELQSAGNNLDVTAPDAGDVQRLLKVLGELEELKSKWEGDSFPGATVLSPKDMSRARKTLKSFLESYKKIEVDIEALTAQTPADGADPGQKKDSTAADDKSQTKGKKTEVPSTVEMHSLSGRQRKRYGMTWARGF
ncbi:hypothetical protein T439DRAFT_337110 [Meredithblackwellia eburnea MCA 4105]